ncbi:MAG: CoA transferase, partial [Acidimicrobiales bacterium]
MAEPDSRTPSSPLHDIRVVDLTTARGQLCGRVLADLGAEVLLIEPPSGLAARRVGPFAPDGRSLFFESFARGKASVALDLVADREAVLELIDKADIVLESSGPGELVALGYGFAELSDRPGRERPLVYTSITPFGQSGPHAGNPATDLTIEAAAGQVAMQGTGARSPIPVSVPLASLNGSVQAAADTLMALRHRDRVGVGQHLDTSMQAAMVWSTMSASGFFPVDGRDAPQSDQRRTRGPRDIAPGTTLPLIERCADGWVYLTMPILGRVSTDSFAALMAWLHEEAPMPKVVAEVDWGMWLINLFGGKVGGDEIASGIALLREFLATKTKQEIHSRALQDRILMAPLNDAADLLADPHLVERGLWTGLGEAQRVGTWAHLSATPMQPGTTAPEIGSSRNGWGPSIVAATPLRKESAVPDDGGGIFGDLKVADFSWAAAGPVITRTLADHGATVVKVESQARPDNMRFMGPFKDAKRGTDRSFPAANMNVSKLGLALDFSSDDGRQVAAELIDWADVVVENFAPGVM